MCGEKARGCAHVAKYVPRHLLSSPLIRPRASLMPGAIDWGLISAAPGQGQRLGADSIDQGTGREARPQKRSAVWPRRRPRRRPRRTQLVQRARGASRLVPRRVRRQLGASCSARHAAGPRLAGPHWPASHGARPLALIIFAFEATSAPSTQFARARRQRTNLKRPVGRKPSLLRWARVWRTRTQRLGRCAPLATDSHWRQQLSGRSNTNIENH